MCVCVSVDGRKRACRILCVRESRRERESEIERVIWGRSTFLALGHRTYFHHPAVCTFSVSVEITLYSGHVNISRCTIYLFFQTATVFLNTKNIYILKCFF